MDAQQTAILKKLKGELQYGDNVELAKRTQYTREYVGMCLNPKKDCYNTEIVAAALLLIEERKEIERQQLKQLKQLEKDRA